jgi:hypothetical protein
LDIFQENRVRKTFVGRIRTSDRSDARLRRPSADGRPLHPAVGFGGRPFRPLVAHSDHRMEWRRACHPLEVHRGPRMFDVSASMSVGRPGARQPCIVPQILPICWHCFILEYPYTSQPGTPCKHCKMSSTCCPQKKRPRVTRILRSTGGFLPSISVAAVIPCHIQRAPTIHDLLRCHPARSQKSINRVHQFPQTHPQRTLLCIKLEVDLHHFLLCGMAHPLAIPLSVSNVG